MTKKTSKAVYAVGQIVTEGEDAFGRTVKLNVGGIHGFLPVFTTRKAAEKWAGGFPVFTLAYGSNETL